MINYTCPKCSELIITTPDMVSDGYFGFCENCDEDFYEFELGTTDSSFHREALVDYRMTIEKPRENKTLKEMRDDIDFDVYEHWNEIEASGELIVLKKENTFLGKLFKKLRR